jgi:hypothetical protein
VNACTSERACIQVGTADARRSLAPAYLERRNRHAIARRLASGRVEGPLVLNVVERVADVPHGEVDAERHVVDLLRLTHRDAPLCLRNERGRRRVGEEC